MQKNLYSDLTEKLLGQTFVESGRMNDEFSAAKIAALQHSKIENAIAVVSNIRDNSSFIVYGKLGNSMGFSMEKEGEEVSSIWEEEILRRIHPDDMVEKMAQELQFITFVQGIPVEDRHDYYLQHVLRMRNTEGEYLYFVHRIFYLHYDDGGNVMLALCLYTIAGEQMPVVGIVNTMTGHITKFHATEMSLLLSEREKEILMLIGKGKASKEIADKLCISQHTVNAHRQNILKKMHVSNSTEAYNVARRLGIL